MGCDTVCITIYEVLTVGNKNTPRPKVFRLVLNGAAIFVNFV